MADQIETTKNVAYIVSGSDSDEATASKVVMYFVLQPGDIEPGDTASRQSHVYAQIITRS
jgi:hypothetical protein